MTSRRRARSLVHFGDEVRLGQVQLVEGSIQEDAFRVQHRPHRAVTDEDARSSSSRNGAFFIKHGRLALQRQLFRVIQRHRVDEQIRRRDQVEPDRTDALTHPVE